MDKQTSRNRDPERRFARCACGERVDLTRHWAAIPHCATCHAGDHYACRQCGRCLPPAGWGAFGEGRVRIDRLYCGPACRQKAYRARRRGAARVPPLDKQCSPEEQ